MVLIGMEEIEKAQRALHRERFMPGLEGLANVDAAFPIGHGQTISQPSLVRYMTWMLGMERTSKVLEIGTGSGYQTALLAAFTDRVYTVERIEALLKSARERLVRMGCDNIHYLLGNGWTGWEEEAPFDRIMVTAAAKEIPTALIEQLSVGGRMVIPVGTTYQYLFLVEKEAQGRIRTTRDLAVRFVPLVND